MAATRLWVLPMAGRSMALTRELERAQSDDLPVTPMAEELERRLKETTPPVPWRLVVLDPLSRFAGGDVEKDNAAATRFVQVLERMAHLGPTVLVTHHTTKIARSQDVVAKTDAAATIAARGASGLTDGVRWVATLSGLPRVDGQRLSELAVTKSNYGWTPDPVILVAEESANGALRVATDDEVRHYEASTEQTTTQSKAAKKTNGASRGKNRNEPDDDDRPSPLD
jgi:RecA-family ATPase